MDDGRAGAPGQPWHFCRRVDQAGGAYRYQHITVMRRCECGIQRVERKAFAKPDHAGAQQAIADRALRWLHSTTAFRLVGHAKRFA